MRSSGSVFVELHKTQKDFFVWTPVELSSGRTSSVKERTGLIFHVLLHKAFCFIFLSLKWLNCFLNPHLYSIYLLDTVSPKWSTISGFMWFSFWSLLASSEALIITFYMWEAFNIVGKACSLESGSLGSNLSSHHWLKDMT